jgi:integrase/predicted RNA-binding Zn-ribbon protein involved in translation (DUF1610 family)
MAELTSKESLPDCIFGKAGSKSCKSESADGSAGISPLCPQCGSKKLWRDGNRYSLFDDKIQRWLCRDCGFRFSERPLQNSSKRSLNTSSALSSKRQICALGAKNLTSATEIKTVAGDKVRKLQKHIDLLPEDVRGLLTKFMAYLEREGRCEEIKYPDILTHLVRDGADLLDSESVKAVIAKQKKKNCESWSDSMKMLAVCAYDAFCLMQGITWRRPGYRQNEATVMVPDEKDLDLLISAASKRMATFLLCLKETYADPSEILHADWIDFNGNVFSINHPVKFHYPGKYELSMRLTSMLNALPRKSKRIFPMRYQTAYACLAALRRKAAEKFQNPALLQISFKSFRHWGGSMVAYYSNGNAIVIARVLRHKSWKSTQKYVHTIEFKEEDYEVTTATTAEEINALGKAGWTKYDEATFNGVQMHFYRKPKRFGSFKNMDNKSQTIGISNYNS